MVEPGHNVRIILCPGAWIFGIDDFGSQGTLVKDLSEVIDLCGFGRLDVRIRLLHGASPMQIENQGVPEDGSQTEGKAIREGQPLLRLENKQEHGTQVWRCTEHDKIVHLSGPCGCNNE